MGAISSGSVVVNDVGFQLANAELPLGGIGNSGMGHYRGTVWMSLSAMYLLLYVVQ